MSQITVAVAEPQVSHFQCARSRLGPYRYTTASARIMTTASAGHRAYLMISEAKEFKPTKLKRMGTTTSTATAASNITMASRVKSMVNGVGLDEAAGFLDAIHHVHRAHHRSCRSAR